MRNLINCFVILLVLVCIDHVAPAQFNSVSIISPPKAGMIAIQAKELLTSQITSRCDARIVDDNTQLNIEVGNGKNERS